ncbi:MAG: hypothetical protein Ct9H300mP29_4120 [Candidatus Neomarinimicrobiota bacterium]|nr:MAG: hypothetical protein Ct9H300mP29_4120 [Candidatus Neomarinimicrobiota bacterium]
MYFFTITDFVCYGDYIRCLCHLNAERYEEVDAYSSVSHMGFVTLGLFTFKTKGIEGGILQMINHGVITGALFLCVGMIYERTHSRMIEDYGGLSKTVPIFIVFFSIFTLAAIGSQV